MYNQQAAKYIRSTRPISIIQSHYITKARAKTPASAKLIGSIIDEAPLGLTTSVSVDTGFSPPLVPEGVGVRGTVSVGVGR